MRTNLTELEASTYNSWQHMKKRCDDKNSLKYKYYGAKGIKYQPSWESFDNFMRDMGVKPSLSHTIDRIDNNGDYCKDNCRWATTDEQAANKRQNGGKTGVSKSGLYGIVWSDTNKRWLVRVKVRGRFRYIGRTKDLEEAKRMRDAGKLKYENDEKLAEGIC